MSSLHSKLFPGAVLAFLVGTSAAQAVTPLYSGGSTMVENAFRDMFNCYGSHSGSDTLVGLYGFSARCNAVTPYNANAEVLYLGSGNGRASFVNHDASHFTDGPRIPDAVPVASTSDFGPFYGTGTGANWVPAGSGPAFPSLAFVSSEEPLSASDIATYDRVSGGHWGAPIQVPGLILAVAIPFHKTAVWNENGAVITSASSQVSLTTDTLCGIFTGAITDWSDNAFVAANGGAQLGKGPIKVFYRADGSGGTFLLSNALIHQCAYTTHPIPAAWQTAPGNSAGVGNELFFLNASRRALLPANFAPVPAGQTMEAMINSTVGSIGYDSPSFTQYVDTAGPEMANLQSFASIGTTTPVFWPAAAQYTYEILGSTLPPSSKAGSCNATTATGTAPFIQSDDGICADNPLNWGLTFPMPTATNAYPIGGFGFIDTYTCFASPDTRDAMASTTAGNLGLLRWWFGTTLENSSRPKVELNRNGLVIVPGSWVGAAKRLLTYSSTTRIGSPGDAGTGCATVTGGA